MGAAPTCGVDLDPPGPDRADMIGQGARYTFLSETTAPYSGTNGRGGLFHKIHALTFLIEFWNGIMLQYLNYPVLFVQQPSNFQRAVWSVRQFRSTYQKPRLQLPATRSLHQLVAGKQKQ